jgi:hypothetical protein
MPRNAQGKFVSKEEAPVDATPEEELMQAESPKKTAREIELEEQLAALRASIPETELDQKFDEGVKEDAKPEMPALRLQSKYRNHVFQIRNTRRIFHPTLSMVEPVPGLFARFTGPQRIFDSEVAQEELGWTDAERDQVERKLVTDNAFMTDYYPAPMSTVPEHLLALAKRKPPTRIKKCFGFGFVEGQLTQCSKQATAGSDYCPEHDPDVTRIMTGGGTTVG